MPKSDLEKLMDTLKVDSTSPWVNKDTLMKAMKAADTVDKELDNKINTVISNDSPARIEVEDITEIPSSTLENLTKGDIVVEDYSFTVTYVGDDIYLVTIFNSTIAIHKYSWDENDSEYKYAGNSEYDLADFPTEVGTKLYLHHFYLTCATNSNVYDVEIFIVNTVPNKITTFSGIEDALSRSISGRIKCGITGTTYSYGFIFAGVTYTGTEYAIQGQSLITSSGVNIGVLYNFTYRDYAQGDTVTPL